MSKNQLTKIVVKGEQDSILINGRLQDDRVRFPRQTFTRVYDIVALLPHRLSDAQRKILIGKIALAHADLACGVSR